MDKGIYCEIYAEECKCAHCSGIADIRILKDTEKGTWPAIEFCPFCGMSNARLTETE